MTCEEVSGEKGIRCRLKTAVSSDVTHALVMPVLAPLSNPVPIQDLDCHAIIAAGVENHATSATPPPRSQFYRLVVIFDLVTNRIRMQKLVV